jgi:hypothetical protein
MYSCYTSSATGAKPGCSWRCNFLNASQAPDEFFSRQRARSAPLEPHGDPAVHRVGGKRLLLTREAVHEDGKTLHRFPIFFQKIIGGNHLDVYRSGSSAIPSVCTGHEEGVPAARNQSPPASAQPPAILGDQPAHLCHPPTVLRQSSQKARQEGIVLAYQSSGEFLRWDPYYLCILLKGGSMRGASLSKSPSGMSSAYPSSVERSHDQMKSEASGGGARRSDHTL